MKFYFYHILVIVLSIFLTDCSHPRKPAYQLIRIKGSDTMQILVKQLAREYMIRNPGSSVHIDGASTSEGVQALIARNSEICAASRALKPEEIKQIAEKYKSVGFQFRIAKDALSIYVHPKNPIKNLTINEIKQIFTGEIQNWSELNVPDLPVNLFIRPPTSGTHHYFKEHILDGQEFSSTAQILATTRQITEHVSNQTGGIGFGGIAYGKDIITHSLVEGIAPTEENARSNLYPLSRYLYFYTIHKPNSTVKKFIDWVMSREAQKIVKDAGYISLWSETG